MPTLTTHNAIDELPASEWNELVDPDAPFLRHEFLAALEHNGCVGEEFGWLPQHLALRADSGELLAAAPCYIKHNSYGEFVFDWAWADAYRRSGPITRSWSRLCPTPRQQALASSPEIRSGGATTPRP